MYASKSPARIKLFAALAAAACLALPSLAVAQSYPSYAVAPQQTIKGTISGFNGAYTVYVQDEKGYGDNVQMHDGTVINPTGLKLQEGMHVTIYGYANGSVFQAYRIDAPYPAYYGSAYDNGYGSGGAYYGGYGYGAYPYYGGYGYPFGGYYGGWYPYWGIGVGWWGGGWGPGWGGGWGGGPIFYRGPGFFGGRHGTLSAPPRGGMGAPRSGGFARGGPYHGTLSAPPRGGMGAPRSGGFGGGPPRGGGGGMGGGGGHGTVHGRPPH